MVVLLLTDYETLSNVEVWFDGIFLFVVGSYNPFKWPPPTPFFGVISKHLHSFHVPLMSVWNFHIADLPLLFLWKKTYIGWKFENSDGSWQWFYGHFVINPVWHPMVASLPITSHLCVTFKDFTISRNASHFSPHMKLNEYSCLSRETSI